MRFCYRQLWYLAMRILYEIGTVSMQWEGLITVCLFRPASLCYYSMLQTVAVSGPIIISTIFYTVEFRLLDELTVAMPGCMA